MGFDITIYRATRMKAEAKHGRSSHWVTVTILEGATESEMTIFFDGNHAHRKAEAYAAAINQADVAFHPAEVARELADA